MPRVLYATDLSHFKAHIGQERNYFFTHEAFRRPLAYVNNTVRRREDFAFKQPIDWAQHMVSLVTISDIAPNERVICVKDRSQGRHDYDRQSGFPCSFEYRLADLFLCRSRAVMSVLTQKVTSATQGKRLSPARLCCINSTLGLLTRCWASSSKAAE